MTKYENTQMRYNVPLENRVIHPLYHGDSALNNIGLIKLPQRVSFNPYIQAVRIAPAYAGSYAGEIGMFVGWGIYGLFFKTRTLRYFPLIVKRRLTCM